MPQHSQHKPNTKPNLKPNHNHNHNPNHKPNPFTITLTLTLALCTTTDEGLEVLALDRDRVLVTFLYSYPKEFLLAGKDKAKEDEKDQGNSRGRVSMGGKEGGREGRTGRGDIGGRSAVSPYTRAAPTRTPMSKKAGGFISGKVSEWLSRGNCISIRLARYMICDICDI